MALELILTGAVVAAGVAKLLNILTGGCGSWYKGWTKSDINNLPADPGVYILHWSRGKTHRVYIGSTQNLRRRLRQHARRRWTSFDWTSCSDIQRARDLERELIRQAKQAYKAVHAKKPTTVPIGWTGS